VAYTKLFQKPLTRLASQTRPGTRQSPRLSSQSV
jgi:hypothetical protein